MSDKTPRLYPERIEELMKRRGWDIGILSYRSGVKPNTIYKYLTGARKVQSTVANLAYLARALGTSIEFFIGMTDIDSPANVANLTEAQREMIARVGEMSPRRQREAAAYFRLLLDMDEQDRQWLKHNLETNKKLLDFINFMGGEDAFFDLLNSLGKQVDTTEVKGEDSDQEVNTGVKGEESNPNDSDDADDSNDADEDEAED